MKSYILCYLVSGWLLLLIVVPVTGQGETASTTRKDGDVCRRKREGNLYHCVCALLNVSYRPWDLCEDAGKCAFYNATCVTVCPDASPLRAPGGFCETQCPAKHYLKLVEPKWTACVAECPNNHLEMNGTCFQCADQCNGCNGLNNFDCLKCRYAWFNLSCVPRCPDRMARVDDTCFPLDHCRHVIHNGDCVQKCPSGFFHKSVNNSKFEICGACHNECQGECRGEGNGKCIGCKHYRYNDTCVPACPVVAQVSFKRECFPSCPHFMVQGKCLERCPGGKLEFNHSCMDTCPPEAPISRKGKCVQVCNTVLHKNECLDRCPSNLYLYNESCIDNCPDVASIMNGTHCVNHCNDFTLGSHCVKSCPEQYSIDNRTCILKCPEERFYRDPKSRECKSECLYYFAEYCREKCPGSLTGFNHTCLPECPDITMQNDGICISNCSSVNKYDYKRTCVSKCPKDKPVSVNRTCVETCPHPLLRDTNHECVVRCSNYYESFVYNYVCMHKCPQDAPVYANHVCFQHCPLQLLQDWNSKCVDKCSSHASYIYNRTCIPHCPIEASFSVNHTCFVTCPAGYFINDKLCVRECLLSQVHVGLHCVKINCSSDAPYIMERKCVHQCPPSHIFRQGNICLSKCPADWKYSGKMLTECIETCPKYSVDACYNMSSCPHRYQVWDGDKCSDKCKLRQYRFKHLCLSSCSTYNIELLETGSNTCGISCPPARPLIDYSTCVKSCDSFSYEKGNKCVSSSQCPATWGIDFRRLCVEKCDSDAQIIPVQDASLAVAFQCAPYYTVRTQVIVAVLFGINVLFVGWYLVQQVIRRKWRRKQEYRIIDDKLECLSLHSRTQNGSDRCMANSDGDDPSNQRGHLERETTATVPEETNARVPQFESSCSGDGADRPQSDRTACESNIVHISVHQTPETLYETDIDQDSLNVSLVNFTQDRNSITSRDLSRLQDEEERNRRMMLDLLQDDTFDAGLPLLPVQEFDGAQLVDTSARLAPDEHAIELQQL